MNGKELMQSKAYTAARLRRRHTSTTGSASHYRDAAATGWQRPFGALLVLLLVFFVFILLQTHSCLVVMDLDAAAAGSSRHQLFPSFLFHQSQKVTSSTSSVVGGGLNSVKKYLLAQDAIPPELLLQADNNNNKNNNNNNNDEKEQVQQTEAEKQKAMLISQLAGKQQQQQVQQQEQVTNSDYSADISYQKYLVFTGFMSGQGTGNIISGLLSAHLLGIEFNRTVCVDESFEDFHAAFSAIHPTAVRECPHVLEQRYKWFNDKSLLISLVNFAGAPDECELQAKLAADTPILMMNGNTYPRWPVVPDNFFFTYYRPKPQLIQILPYEPAHPPKIVVHLREPDDRRADMRPGLDLPTFQALGELLPADDTYLVTNRVAWYDYFEQNYHWKHPQWDVVVHSAMGKSWGDRQGQAFGQVNPHVASHGSKDRSLQTLQMWADWFTILTAQVVFHTHSDFSISAIHWQNLNSKVIRGVNGGTLELGDESWRVDGETARLVDRRVNAPGTSELRRCSHPELYTKQ